jgi:hypothetical protein
MVDIREHALVAADEFYAQAEFRGGVLSRNDSASWECLVKAVKEVDAVIDLLTPKVARSSSIHAVTRGRRKAPRPARGFATPAVPDNPADIDWS